MVENTGNIVAVNKILGHADLKKTIRYAHTEDSLKDAVEALSSHNSESNDHISAHISESAT